MDALHDKPIDMNAVKVVFFKGVHFDPTLTRDKGTHQHWYQIPPETNAVPMGITDITGLQRGKMTIMGYLKNVPAPRKNTGGSRGRRHIWLARCVCGRYETRNGQNWHAAYQKGIEDMCHYCSYLWRLMHPKTEEGGQG